MNKKNIVKNKESKTEIDYSFKYIYYEDNETLTQDNSIKNIDVSQNTKKYIEINIRNVYENFFNVNNEGQIGNNLGLSVTPTSLSQDEVNVGDPNKPLWRNALIGRLGEISSSGDLNLEVRPIENSSTIYDFVDNEYLENLNDKSLNNDELNLFNTIDIIDSYTSYLQEDVNSSDIENVFSFYNIDINDNNIESYNNFIEFSKQSKNLTSSLLFNDNIVKIKSKSLLKNKRIVDNLNAYRKLFVRNTSKITRANNDLESSINNNIFRFIFGSYRDSIIKNENIFIGYLVKKYLKSGEDFQLKDARFFYKNNQIKSLEEVEDNFTMRDEGVKYGQVYKYIIYPVTFSVFDSNENDNFKEAYLLCNNPIVTENIVCEEFLRPPPPINLNGFYNKNNKVFYLEWDLPVNDQQDIKGFQIFKRFSIEQPYSLVSQIESHNVNDFYTRNANVNESKLIRNENKLILEYHDKDFDPSKLNIYTICSIDAHGLVSNYSSQIGYLYNYLKNETKADLISYQGAPLFYPNLMIPKKTIFIDNDEKIVTITPKVYKKRKFTLMATPDVLKYKTISAMQVSDDKNLYKTGDKSFYKFSMFRANNNSLFEDKIKIVDFDEN